MPPSNDINWEDRFGKPPENWSQGEFRMAVISTLNTQNTQWKLLTTSLELLTKTVSLLPCSKHDDKIIELTDCMKKFKNFNGEVGVETIRGKFSLRTAALNGGFILLGAVITILMNYFIARAG